MKHRFGSIAIRDALFITLTAVVGILVLHRVNAVRAHREVFLANLRKIPAYPLLTFGLAMVLAVVLFEARGIARNLSISQWKIADIEREHPHLPRDSEVITAFILTIVFLALFLEMVFKATAAGIPMVPMPPDPALLLLPMD